MDTIEFEASHPFSLAMDERDSLRSYREKFHIPKTPGGKDCIYFCGNSLGLQPKKARTYIEAELDDWAQLGVKGHLEAKHPWLPYHEFLTEPVARLVGAKPIEVVVMNTLSVNLHLMMISFYQPTPKRHKILIEKGAFPSDQYAVHSQIKFHGFEPKESLIELQPRNGEATLRTEDILKVIHEAGPSIALVLLGNVNYLTGQAFDVEAITKAGHAQNCFVGFDLAHGAGNLELKLHDWGPDFAVWCSYKYINAGPGALAGCFVHERHAHASRLPRLSGWWGHNKKTRFQMPAEFDPIEGAEGWQLSNPPILQLAALRSSLELFDQATLPALRAKSVLLTRYLEFLIDQLPSEYCRIITPRDPNQRGAQLSLKLKGDPRKIQERWLATGIICDFREPDIIRVAPTALYNRFSDVYLFFETLKEDAKNAQH